MRTGYLGPQGSYSYLASKIMTSESEFIPFDSFPKLMHALCRGEVDCTVIPIENTLNGGVLQNIDLLQSAENVFADSQCVIKIEHRLAVKSGADLKNIKRIYSHRQALEQCSGYLFKNFPDACLHEAVSTSKSLEMIKTEEDAGIVGAHTHKEGITLLDGDVSDSKDNFTHFLRLVRGVPSENKRTEKIYFSVTCPNRSGGLLSLLQKIARHGLNMTKIESRPVKERLNEFRFFIEAEGDYSQSSVRLALSDVEKESASFKLLGAY